MPSWLQHAEGTVLSPLICLASLACTNCIFSAVTGYHHLFLSKLLPHVTSYSYGWAWGPPRKTLRQLISTHMTAGKRQAWMCALRLDSKRAIANTVQHECCQAAAKHWMLGTALQMCKLRSTTLNSSLVTTTLFFSSRIAQRTPHNMWSMLDMYSPSDQ